MTRGDPLHKAFPKWEELPPVLIACRSPGTIHIATSFSPTLQIWEAEEKLQHASVSRAVAEEQSWLSCSKPSLSLSMHVHRKVQKYQ